jgi:hypothetical protein
MSGEDKSEGAGKSGEARMKTIGVLAIGLIIGIIIGVAVGAFAFPQAPSALNVLTAEEAGEVAADFINNNLVQPGTEVILGEVKEESGLYNVTTSYMGNQIPVYITKDGEIVFLQGLGWVQIEEFEEQKKERENQTQESEPERTIGNFIVSGDEICKEDEKPIIYFFGSDGCGHCTWEHPVIVNVTSNFTGYISFHDNMNNVTADTEIFAEYSTGGVPTLVLGCRYYRVGSGANMGEDLEAKSLTALICNLTDKEPIDVCTAPEIEELINKI